MDMESFNYELGKAVATAAATIGEKRAYEMADNFIKRFKRVGRPPRLAATNARVRAEYAQMKKEDAAGARTRKDDAPGKRARVDGDQALINTLRTVPKRVSLGPSISFDNTAFLREMLNRTTTVTVQGGFHFVADQGERAFNFQHFRHNAYKPTYTEEAPTFQKLYTYESMSVGDLATDISLITPETSTSTHGPDRLTPYKAVNSSAGANGGADEYAPFSLPDLENISYDLQDAKKFLCSPNTYAAQVSSGAEANLGRQDWTINKIMMATNKFACRSLIYQQNQHVNTVQETDGTYVNDNHVKCKPVLQGGKVSYQFLNTGTAPAAVTVVVYKVKPRYEVANNAVGYTWKSDYLRNAFLEDVRTSYLNKGSGIRLKDMEGRLPDKDDVTLNANFQFLPKNKSVAPSGNPYVEQYRYTCVVAAGQTKNIELSLPGRMYNPTRMGVSNLNVQPADFDQGYSSAINEDAVHTQAGYRNIPFWSGETYSVAVGVSGCRAMLKFTDDSTTDPASPITEGMDTTSASVTCRVKYTERIGAMHMQYLSKPIRGRPNFDHPSKGTNVNTSVSTIAVVPQATIVRAAGTDGVINLP